MSFIKLVFSLTAIAIEGRVNGMKIILSTQLELERVNAASMEKLQQGQYVTVIEQNYYGEKLNVCQSESIQKVVKVLSTSLNVSLNVTIKCIATKSR